jgi:malate dehydrogenase (oxaloacetate-decarboxylating)
MDYKQKSIELHAELKGKIGVVSRVKVDSMEALATAYTPGVAEPCLRIQKEPDLCYSYTRRGNLVAVISDGSAVLGLGNIGGLAGMPVMEGKCVLFKEFAGVDAFPIVLDTQDTEDIIKTVKNIAPSFGGINLEDITSPRCFEVEERLKKELDIPVFHDDQHGTAIVVLSAITNALKLVGKKFDDIKIVISGPGAAGTAICKLLMARGVENILMCDENGILNVDRDYGKMWHKAELAKLTNAANLKGNLADALIGADVFIGVSAPNIVSVEMIRSMNKDAIVFAMANPTPEITPEKAKEGGALVVGTGRSDYPNQINNVLIFPGLFKGALSVRAVQITTEMKLAAADALASLVSDSELSPDYIIAKPFDPRVGDTVAKAVAKTAIEQGINRI